MLYKVVNLVAFFVLISFNLLLPSGRKIGEVSNSISYLFKPADYAFSIWGIIYLLLFIWIIRQFIGSDSNEDLYKQITPWFLLNVASNVLWIQFFANGKITTSVFAMIGVLISLIMIYLLIQADNHHSSFFQVPFSMYLGWISVATMVNITIALKARGISSLLGIGEYGWTYILLVVGGLLALFILMKNQDYIFPLVIVWAYLGIIVERMSEKNIVIVAATVSIILLLANGVQLLKKIKSL